MLTFEEELTPDEGAVLNGLLFIIHYLAKAAENGRNYKLAKHTLGEALNSRIYNHTLGNPVRQAAERLDNTLHQEAIPP